MIENDEMEYHPTREQLMKIASDKSSRVDEHVKSCETCRAFVFACRMISKGRNEILETPSEEMIAACQSIPRSLRCIKRGERVRARLKYDSWADLPAAAVRDFPIGRTRYLSWQIGRVKLELVGYRKHTGWQFAARVYVRDDIMSGCSLQIGNHQYLPGAQGFIMWDQTRPPRRLILNADNRSIVMEAVSW